MSYCGLVDAKIRASDKDLPVVNTKIYEKTLKNQLPNYKFGTLKW